MDENRAWDYERLLRLLGEGVITEEEFKARTQEFTDTKENLSSSVDDKKAELEAAEELILRKRQELLEAEEAEKVELERSSTEKAALEKAEEEKAELERLREEKIVWEKAKEEKARNDDETKEKSGPRWRALAGLVIVAVAVGVAVFLLQGSEKKDSENTSINTSSTTVPVDTSTTLETNSAPITDQGMIDTSQEIEPGNYCLFDCLFLTGGLEIPEGGKNNPSSTTSVTALVQEPADVCLVDTSSVSLTGDGWCVVSVDYYAYGIGYVTTKIIEFYVGEEPNAEYFLELALAKEESYGDPDYEFFSLMTQPEGLCFTTVAVHDVALRQMIIDPDTDVDNFPSGAQTRLVDLFMECVPEFIAEIYAEDFTGSGAPAECLTQQFLEDKATLRSLLETLWGEDEAFSEELIATIEAMIEFCIHE